MAAAAKAQLDSVVHQAFALHALADAHLGEQIDRSLFEYAGANPLFDVRAAAVLYYDGFDSAQVKKMGEHQTRRPCAYNSDLGSQCGQRFDTLR
jgi:hypothetical protein